MIRWKYNRQVHYLDVDETYRLKWIVSFKAWASFLSLGKRSDKQVVLVVVAVLMLSLLLQVCCIIEVCTHMYLQVLTAAKCEMENEFALCWRPWRPAKSLLMLLLCFGNIPDIPRREQRLKKVRNILAKVAEQAWPSGERHCVYVTLRQHLWGKMNTVLA